MSKEIPKCPICKQSNVECLEFAFIASHSAGKDGVTNEDRINTTYDNISDFNRLYLCPNLHVFDENGEIVKPSNVCPECGELKESEQSVCDLCAQEKSVVIQSK
jgi:hypothetical protein